MHIVFALLSLILASFNDAVFKVYTSKENSIGAYISLIGVFWGGTFFIVVGASSILSMSTTTLLIGLVSGLFSAVANLLLVKGMEKNEASVCSVIYRLNLAVAAILAFVFLGELITLFKLIGICAAIAAIFIFFAPGSQQGKNRTLYSSGLLLIVVACFLRACMGITYKYGLEIGADKYIVLFLNGVTWVICGGLFHLIQKYYTPNRVTVTTIKFGAMSGALVAGIALFMMLALQQGDASVVLPITQLSFLGTVVIGALMLNEKLNIQKTVGLCFGLLCVIAMTVR